MIRDLAYELRQVFRGIFGLAALAMLLLAAAVVISRAML